MIEHNLNVPVGYKVQMGIACCANCMFGGYIGAADEEDRVRLCICEIHGEPSDANYHDIAVEPLGICDAYKPGI
jgi:hypothetical protein